MRLKLLPFHWPDCRAIGARPARDAACLFLEAAEFGHGGNERIGGQRPQASDAGQDLIAACECGIGSDQAGDFSIERLDMPVDLFKSLLALALEDGDREVLLSILERGPITHQAVAGIDESAISACCVLLVGRIGGCRVAAMRARSMASMRSVLASVPIA